MDDHIPHAEKAQEKKLTVYCEQCGHGTESFLGTDAIASLRELMEAAKALMRDLEEHEEDCIESEKMPESFEVGVMASLLMDLRSALQKAKGEA